jgi:hypothetical protein
MLESPASDKHSGLLRTFVNYGSKKFNNICPWSAYLRLPRAHKVTSKHAPLQQIKNKLCRFSAKINYSAAEKRASLARMDLDCKVFQPVPGQIGAHSLALRLLVYNHLADWHFTDAHFVDKLIFVMSGQNVCRINVFLIMLQLTICCYNGSRMRYASFVWKTFGWQTFCWHSHDLIIQLIFSWCIDKMSVCQEFLDQKTQAARYFF